MTREELISEATRIPQPSPEAAREYEDRSEAMASELNRLMSGRKDLDRLIGDGNHDIMEENHRNHARFIGSLLSDFKPEVLVNTVLWVFRAYRAHGFRLAYWPAQLDNWVEVLRKTLSPAAFDAVYPVYRFMLIRQPDFAALTDN